MPVENSESGERSRVLASAAGVSPAWSPDELSGIARGSNAGSAYTVGNLGRRLSSCVSSSNPIKGQASLPLSLPVTCGFLTYLDPVGRPTLRFHFAQIALLLCDQFFAVRVSLGRHIAAIGLCR